MAAEFADLHIHICGHLLEILEKFWRKPSSDLVFNTSQGGSHTASDEHSSLESRKLADSSFSASNYSMLKSLFITPTSTLLSV